MEFSMKNKAAKKKSTNPKKKLITALRYLALVLGALVMLYPILWLFGASFKSNSEIFQSIWFVPNQLDFTPYIEGWKTSSQYTFFTYFMNSFLIVIPKVLLTLISCTLAAYGFSRFDFPLKKVFFPIMIGTLFLPGIVTRIPLYIFWKNLNLLDSYIPLIANSAFACDTFFVYMLVQFFRSVPKELDEAARMDGCNSFMTLIRVLVPILKPSLITAGLFQFIWTFTDFQGPLIYISSVEKYPVSLALRMALDTTSADFSWNKNIAMSIIGLIPSILIYFSAQKHFIGGSTAGGVKG
ncbi:carbohydrate ABC transporter permease [Enterococcus gallinarum]|uniref:Carbohydrate ABC transporter permease n=1 Tax=Enterococcus gallinarum TaxID=1353 RepID=A0ABD4HNK0_ENTGA|nr:carbohydrate ABC transporter permease [Enterococcus gallinarum]MBA0948761.1 carbohydrate ABC transporter permease [Enterococcus gallinarum]MBA0961765.1 carbohydrate ABC transporter permease [Enterococcus gallinarum]MBA0969710.1 carbohydrate ABC transporter permease [Enterococcus gallinarum]MBA0973060.1 carbohydrate ABC transporter permease [Enterococcus gallinarum]MBR8697145.1 carbohydrate ABC transporter permease [Enterococcus gallinarum]